MTVSRKPIVVVGSVNMDLVTHCREIPVPGETVIGTGFETTPGGKGANQAVAAARLGYPTAMVGAVGEDVFGQSLLDHLSRAGVSTHSVARANGPSGIATIVLTASAENSIIVVPGANGQMNPAVVDRQAALIRSAGMVLCQLELPSESVAHTLELCAQAGVPVILDPAPAAPLPASIWTQTTWFTPNETEAAFYAGSGTRVEDAAKFLLAQGLHGVILKRGSEGAYAALAGGEAGWIKPFPVQAVDTVAAGDCFNGALAVALLEGQNPFAAARFASAAAALSVTRKGAQASMPTRAEVDEFLRNQS